MADSILVQVQSSLGAGYTIERELGGGGMSRTYVAREHALSRRVVVKVLSPELTAGVSVERFKREILTAAAMQHPHVVPVLSSGDAGGLPWFTMPYVEGESLRVRLARGALSLGESVSILRDVARALAFAHSHGVVHRDIKPDNVLLSEGSATVTDFGIAKALNAARTDGGGATLTIAGTSVGTPAYMAPEQAAGDPNTDHRSDIYAFGCMAYEVLTGRPPFQASSPSRLLGAHLGEKPREIRELRGDIPAALAALVMHCLEKDPGTRPQQASDLARVLDTVTSSGAAAAAPGILAGRIHIGRAVALWGGATALVALTAWAATVVIGLPDWVLPGSLGVMLAGLPIIAFTAWVQRVAHKTYTATPTYTPGGSPSLPQGTLATLAIKASPHVSWRRTWLGGAVAVTAFVVLVVGFMVLRALGIGPAGSLMGAGKLGANEQIVITDFASPANDSTLGVTITEALRADLAQSSVLRVIPRLAMIEAMRLMQRTPSARIDFELGRAIATREGLKAVLDGDVVELGGRYVLSTRLISARDGSQLAAFKEEAESQNDLIPAIGRLAKQLRSKAGESLKNVREASALDRVTTSSLEALRKYAESNVLFDQTADYQRAIPLLEESVAIDSTFAMAWRRLSSYYSNTFRFEAGRNAAIQAYRFADRLNDVERQLTLATYYSLGPEADGEKELAAYQAVLARDSLNSIALNNAALLLMQRRELEKGLEYRLRASSASALIFNNAVNSAVALGRWPLVDSLQREFVRRYPTNPTALTKAARTLAIRGQYERAEQLENEVLPKISANRAGLAGHFGFMSNLHLLRGKVRASFEARAEQRRRQLQTWTTVLNSGLDSVASAAFVLENQGQARSLLERAVRRALDSIPPFDRDYGYLLALAGVIGDSARARQWHAANREQWESAGKRIERPAWEAMDDAMLAFARARYDDALAHLDHADKLNIDRTDVLQSRRFIVLDRLQRTDSAIAVGESYIAGTHPSRFGQDALFLPSIRQRLGEMYESKGNAEKALEHYQAFVTLWKDADPELQPRVRDVQGRIARLQRGRG